MFRNKQKYVQNYVSMEWSASIHISDLNMIKSLKFLKSKVLPSAIGGICEFCESNLFFHMGCLTSFESKIRWFLHLSKVKQIFELF
jgi:hypothetical protein